NQDAAGEAFVVTATDTTTSDTATAAFTDTPPPPGPTVTASDFSITVNPDGTITASVYLDVENGTIDTDHSGGPPNGATEVHLLNSCTDTTQPGGGCSYFLTQVDGTAGGDGHYAITFTPDFAGTDHVDSEDDCC